MFLFDLWKMSSFLTYGKVREKGFLPLFFGLFSFVRSIILENYSPAWL